MKRLLLSVCILVLGLGVFGQTTRYYKCIERVDENGMKEKGNGGMYITFTSTGCYESDENGNRKYINYGPYNIGNHMAYFYAYQGTKNDIHIYFYGVPDLIYGGYMFKYYYYFSKDFTRMNEPHTFNGKTKTDVYVLSTPPEKKETPQELY